ncbi:hypothetical protein CRE_09629 [Caenorhabditis remanei]|uniref:BTB domain-containing protein n=1 Tax=Caenorhabditis remanei TaxID=31234 RepID=E3MJ16_CAERE|nr:hypothetical protein CRE_09629 [Caenorhabditis remanei]
MSSPSSSVIQLDDEMMEDEVEIKKKMDFNDADPNIVDAVIVIEKHKFHVLKGNAARHSAVLYEKFFGEKDSRVDSVTIEESPQTFQYFLEVIHGIPTINDNNVEKILEVAKKYQAPFAVQTCEKFLISNGRMTDKEKLRLSMKYDLTELKEKLIVGVLDSKDLFHLVPKNVEGLDRETKMMFFKKAIDIHGFRKSRTPSPDRILRIHRNWFRRSSESPIQEIVYPEVRL